MAIKANEFRLGNYIKYDDTIQIINGVFLEELCLNESGYIDEDSSLLEPIKLTEEWLTKFGLDLIDWFCEGSYLIVKDKEFGWCFKVRNASHTKEFEFSYFKYVHQLQNAYFSLTGNDLECGGENIKNLNTNAE